MNFIQGFLLGMFLFLGWLGAVYLTVITIGMAWWNAQKLGVIGLRKEIERAVKLMDEMKEELCEAQRQEIG